MRAWTVDADDIRVAEDLDQSQLHRTPEIDDFLSPGGEKFIVVGTKGFGKTLLLKAKRVLLQGSARVVCLPDRSLLDKPIGDKVLSQEAVALYAGSPLWWAKVWLAAIALATLKRLDRTAGLDVSPRFKSLLVDAELRGVIDHFVRLLDFSPTELQRAANDTDGHLVPRLRAVDVPVAIFIDSVDEYFNKHVEARGSRPSATGELSPNIWYFSQLGLVEVGYELRRINHHLKVFAAVRKEAFLRLAESTVMSQQYAGSAVDITYSTASLREIFLNNVRRLPASRLVLQERKDDAIEAFFGATYVSHSVTGDREPIFDYLCRHTLLRPRDLMTVGQRLSAMKPAERREERRLKVTVNQAATEIAQEYLREIAPYLGDLDLPQVLSRLPGHVFTRDELEAVFCEYNDAVGSLAGTEQHVFCALFRAGLIGHLEHDVVDGRRRQRFLRPGEGTFEPDGVLPQSTHYLVHPVLSQIAVRTNPSFAQRIDRANIVGNGRRWREAGEPRTERLCVLQADVRGMLGLIQEGNDATVRQAIVDAVGRHAGSARSCEVSEGDHVTITHDDAALLARIARRVLDDVYDAPGQPLLRVALHHGEVRLQTTESTTLIVGGQAVAIAARVEPHVTPGEIWCTEEFRAELLRGHSLCHTIAIAPTGAHARAEEHAGSPDAGRFNVRKEGSDPADIWVRLYRVAF